MAQDGDELSRSDEHNARGIELADRGWLDEAVNEFRKAIRLDPASAHARDNLGTVFAEQGRLVDALEEFLAALRADPENPTTHHYLGSFIAAHGAQLAASEYRKAIALEFEFPDAHFNLALTLAEHQQLQEALTEFEIAHRQAPDDPGIEHELACCLVDLERYPEAISHLKNILKTNPDAVEVLVDLGVAYTAQGFYAEAEGVLLRALKIDEHEFSAHYHMAGLYVTWGRKNEGLEHLEKAAYYDQEKTRAWLKEDKIFDALAEDERYLKLLA